MYIYRPPQNIFPEKQRKSNNFHGENFLEIHGKDDFLGEFLMTQEALKRKNNASIASKHESRYISFITESNAGYHSLDNTQNISISNFSRKTLRNDKNDEVFYSVISNNKLDASEHYSKSNSLVISVAERQKSMVLDKDKNNDFTNDSCACKCLLI